ncbi:UNVERIFIED_CONTAM: phenylacetaldoxime dehydratase family protein, partial [Prevotella sp. 15_C9]
GTTNVVAVAYWDDHARFTRWFPAVRGAWTERNAAFDGLGRFVEVLSPGVAGYETLFSSPAHREGVAVLADQMSGEI